MRGSRFLYLIILGCLWAGSLLCGSCNDDDYVYPSVVTALVDIHVDADKLVDRLVTDEGETLTLTNRLSAEKLEPNNTFRALCKYERIVAGNDHAAKVYSATLVLSTQPTPRAQFAHGVKTDPLDLQSLWRGGDYLNLVALPKVQDTPHEYNFVEDSLVTRKGCTRLYLTLYHDQSGDYEAYTQKVYLSIPLQSYSLHAGDSIFFRANTYQDGLHTWKLAY